MTRMIRSAQARLRGDDPAAGMTLVVVMGFTVIGMMLAIVAGAIVDRSMNSARGHARFDLAMEVAETGVDQTLARLQEDDNYTACACSVPVGGFADEDEERVWARGTMEALATSDPAMLVDTGQGQYLAIRPDNRQTVYAMSWVPSFERPLKSRVLKTEYLFAPYKPGNALLTQADLNFSGSVFVSNEAPADSAPVHTNGSVTANASTEITGTLTSSGGYDVGGANVAGGSGGGQPKETIPDLDPRYVYESQAADYPTTWYDLCPDGSVHSPDLTTFVPCAGPLLSSSGPFRGWEFTANSSPTPSEWEMTEKNSTYSGVYYIFNANAVMDAQTQNGNPAWNATVIAEALAGGSTDASTCNKLGGDISWKQTDIQNFMPGLVLLAGADLYDSANNDAGSGLFAAADQIYLQTSSATLTGALVAADQCPNPSDPSEVQGVTVKFDQDIESPVMDIIRTTLWLEVVGS